MKNVLVIFALVLLYSFSFAQQIDISEAPRNMKNGTYNSFYFELPDVSNDEAEDHWKKFMKDFKSKTKRNKKSKLWSAEEVTMPRLSDDKVNVYARIIEDSNPNKRTSVMVWFEVGDSYVNSESDSAAGEYAREILTEYAMTTSKHHANSVVSTEEKRLAGMEKELKKLKKQNKDYNEAIDKAKKAIADNEKSLDVNELNQKNLAREIADQKTAVKEAKENARQFNR